MGRNRKYTAEFKSQVVLEILSGEKSVLQVSREHKIKDSLLYRWKSEFVERAPQLFTSGGRDGEQQALEDQVAELERMVGRLTMQLEIAKKASAYWTSRRETNGNSDK